MTDKSKLESDVDNFLAHLKAVMLKSSGIETTEFFYDLCETPILETGEVRRTATGGFTCTLKCKGAVTAHTRSDGS